MRLAGIDGSPKEMEAMAAYLAGDEKGGDAIQDEFLAEARAQYPGRRHCSCTRACKLHGDCVACVIVHRGHRDHLPECFWDMVNEKLAPVSRLTEDSLLKK